MFSELMPIRVKNGSKMLKYILDQYCLFFFADIDVHSGVVQTQAGVVLEKLDTQLGEHGLWIFTTYGNTALIR